MLLYFFLFFWSFVGCLSQIRDFGSINLKNMQSENLSNVVPPTSRSSNYIALRYTDFPRETSVSNWNICIFFMLKYHALFKLLFLLLLLFWYKTDDYSFKKSGAEQPNGPRDKESLLIQNYKKAFKCKLMWKVEQIQKNLCWLPQLEVVNWKKLEIIKRIVLIQVNSSIYFLTSFQISYKKPSLYLTTTVLCLPNSKRAHLPPF